jgi:prevent-host-death family protein
MTVTNDHSVGLRELRHKTSEVIARVRHGETIDVTDHGHLVARIEPAEEPPPGPILQRLLDEGRATPARRPGYLLPMLPGDGTNLLTETLLEMRDDDRW